MLVVAFQRRERIVEPSVQCSVLGESLREAGVDALKLSVEPPLCIPRTRGEEDFPTALAQLVGNANAVLGDGCEAVGETAAQPVQHLQHGGTSSPEEDHARDPQNEQRGQRILGPQVDRLHVASSRHIETYASVRSCGGLSIDPTTRANCDSRYGGRCAAASAGALSATSRVSRQPSLDRSGR